MILENNIEPNPIQEYAEFCRVKNSFSNTKKYDISETSFCLPIFLLCTKVFLAEHKDVKITPPKNPNVASYFDVMIKHKGIKDISKETYVPPVELPSNHDEVNTVLERLRGMHKDGREYGGHDAFNYLMGELVTNIYEHSKFSHAFVMAQKYEHKGFVEIAFIDNGITIAGSYEKTGMKITSIDALKAALRGKSTKDKDRGFGVSTSVKLVTEGLKGQIIIVSNKAAYYAPNDKQANLYTLDPSSELNGTLIGVRLPYPCPKVNIYDYVE